MSRLSSHVRLVASVLAQQEQTFLMGPVVPPTGHYGNVWEHLFFSTGHTMNGHLRHLVGGEAEDADILQ